LVVTCAHAVVDAGSAPGGTLAVEEFTTGRILTAQVLIV
jgi:hypothetical protein